MNYLIIPDVHNRVEWAESLIATFPGRVVIFLGDYFDNYEDTPSIARHTAQWLRYSLDQGRIHLMGNHDLPYRWAGITCPGWTKDKHREVNRVLAHYDWGKLRLVFILRFNKLEVIPQERLVEQRRPLVISHAGVTLANLYGAGAPADTAKNGRLSHLRDRTVDEHLEEIRRQHDLCRYLAESGGDHHWLNQGVRMGHRNVAGPFWLDRHDFNPIAGIDQIMGHTRVSTPQRHCMPHAQAPVSENWFIDGAGKFAALITNGVVVPIWVTPERMGEPTT
jgi:hypothetical protein